MERVAYVWRCPYHGNLRSNGWINDRFSVEALSRVPITQWAVVGKIDTVAFIVSCDGLSREGVKAYAEMLLIGGCEWAKS